MATVVYQSGNIDFGKPVLWSTQSKLDLAQDAIAFVKYYQFVMMVHGRQ